MAASPWRPTVLRSTPVRSATVRARRRWQPPAGSMVDEDDTGQGGLLEHPHPSVRRQGATLRGRAFRTRPSSLFPSCFGWKPLLASQGAGSLSNCWTRSTHSCAAPGSTPVGSPRTCAKKRFVLRASRASSPTMPCTSRWRCGGVSPSSRSMRRSSRAAWSASRTFAQSGSTDILSRGSPGCRATRCPQARRRVRVEAEGVTSPRHRTSGKRIDDPDGAEAPARLEVFGVERVATGVFRSTDHECVPE